MLFEQTPTRRHLIFKIFKTISTFAFVGGGLATRPDCRIFCQPAGDEQTGDERAGDEHHGQPADKTVDDDVDVDEFLHSGRKRLRRHVVESDGEEEDEPLHLSLTAHPPKVSKTATESDAEPTGTDISGMDIADVAEADEHNQPDAVPARIIAVIDWARCSAYQQHQAMLTDAHWGWSVKELQAALVALGKRKSGSKGQLIQRLNTARQERRRLYIAPEFLRRA